MKWMRDQVVPVVFLSRERPPPEPPVNPDARLLCWGKASDFSFKPAPPPDPEPQVIVEGDEEMLVYGVEVHREVQKKSISDPGTSGGAVEAEALKSVTFYIGTRDVWTPVKQGNLQMYFLSQTVDEYYRIAFPQFEAEDERGQEPQNQGTAPPGAQPIAPAYSPPKATEYRVPIDAGSGDVDGEE